MSSLAPSLRLSLVLSVTLSLFLYDSPLTSPVLALFFSLSMARGPSKRPLEPPKQFLPTQTPDFSELFFTSANFRWCTKEPWRGEVWVRQASEEKGRAP